MTETTARNRPWWLAWLLAAAGLGGLASLAIPGAGGFDWNELLTAGSLTQVIFWELRLPRYVLGLVVGGALAGAGHLVQNTVRNPLASPDLLGVTAGAGTGALLVLTLTAWGSEVWGLPLGAVAGGLATAGLIFGLARAAPGRDLGLILAGMALSSLLAAASSLLLTFSREGTVSRYLFWLMGSLENRRWDQVLPTAGGLLVLLASMAWAARRLNFFALGPDGARSLGFAWTFWRRLNLLLATAAASLCVAVSGAIGFVGLLIPHAVRLAMGEEASRNFPLTVVAGALFLPLADLLARSLFAPLEVPVGIFTALAGVPFFLLLLRRLR